jgi:hypothetical protein
VGLVDGLHPDLVDAVQDVEQVPLRVDRDLVDRADDLADDSLPGGGARNVAEPTCQVRNPLMAFSAACWQ